MKRLAIFLGAILIASQVPARKAVPRPPIFGIAHVRMLRADRQSSLNFYGRTLGYHSPQPCKDEALSCFYVGGPQFIELGPIVLGSSGSLLEEVGFLTSDVSAMRKFLLAEGLHPSKIEMHGYSASSDTVSGPDGTRTTFRSSYPSVSIEDPEGKRVVFVQQHGGGYYLDYDPRVGKHLIHAGFVVRDRAAEDRFYKDILGFHLYWQGGRKDDETDWVNMQVPEGTDWIEYMLNVPADANHHTLGVMNHIALGVPDIHVAQNQLLANGMKLMEEPHIGRGGKWQLNLYDPDDTRIELMEFTPVQKSCCSEYTGPHPKP
jgi:catechol 2,3-dioxygenase-like lactoylglutathione lyase family enzyme